MKLLNFTIQEEDAQGNKKRRPLEPHELASNVKQLIVEGQLKENPEQPSGTTSLVNMQVRHRLKTEEGLKWYKGKVISQVRIINSYLELRIVTLNKLSSVHHIFGEEIRKLFPGTFLYLVLCQAMKKK